MPRCNGGRRQHTTIGLLTPFKLSLAAALLSLAACNNTTSSLLEGCIEGSSAAISGDSDLGFGFVPRQIADDVGDQVYRGELIWYDGWPHLDSYPRSGRSAMSLRVESVPGPIRVVRDATSESPLSGCEDAVVRQAVHLSLTTQDQSLGVEQDIELELEPDGATFAPTLLLESFRGSFSARATDQGVRWVAALEGELYTDGEFIARLVLYGNRGSERRRMVLAVAYFADVQ